MSNMANFSFDSLRERAMFVKAFHLMRINYVMEDLIFHKYAGECTTSNNMQLIQQDLVKEVDRFKELVENTPEEEFFKNLSVEIAVSCDPNASQIVAEFKYIHPDKEVIKHTTRFGYKFFC